MLRIMAYSEPQYIENPGIFRRRPIFSTLLYSGSEGYFQPCQASRIERFKKQCKFFFELFSYMSNCDLRETTDLKIKLVLNILAFLDILDLIRSHAWTFSQIQWPGLTQDIQNSNKSKTLVYSEPCHIHNLHILGTLVLTELRHIQSHSQTR